MRLDTKTWGRLLPITPTMEKITASLDACFRGGQSPGMSQFETSLQSFQEVLKGLPSLQPCLEQAAALAGDALLAGNKLMFCGNGGSASDSAHIATEFTCRFKEDRRPYPARWRPLRSRAMFSLF